MRMNRLTFARGRVVLINLRIVALYLQIQVLARVLLLDSINRALSILETLRRHCLPLKLNIQFLSWRNNRSRFPLEKNLSRLRTRFQIMPIFRRILQTENSQFSLAIPQLDIDNLELMFLQLVAARKHVTFRVNPLSVDKYIVRAPVILVGTVVNLTTHL